MRAYNFWSSGHNLTKFYQGMWLIAGVIMLALILQGVPPTKFGRVRNVQNSALFVTSFDLVANIPGTDQHIENRIST